MYFKQIEQSNEINSEKKKTNQKKLNFFDVTIINTGVGKYEFKIHRKNAITNIHIKPHLLVHLLLIKEISKGFFLFQSKIENTGNNIVKCYTMVIYY